MFVLLRPGWLAIDNGRATRNSFSRSAKVKALRRYHDLKTVCTKFRDILSSAPGVLAVCKSEMEASPTGVLKWLKANQHAKYLTVYTNGALEVLLHPLFSLWFSRLTAVSFAYATVTSLSNLFYFTSITVCQLHEPAEPVLNLQALARLSGLECLCLQAGYCQALHLPTALTQLEVNSAHVVCAPSATNALKDVSLTSGSTLALHGTGVATCTAMTQLHLSFSSKITGDSREHKCDSYSPLPSVMSALVQLSDMTMGAKKGKVDLSEFSTLRNICKLHLTLVGAKILTGRLKTLTALEIAAFPALTATNPDDELVMLGVNLRCLQNLKSFRVTGLVVLSRALLPLTCMSSLQSVFLNDFKLGSQSALCSIW